LRPVRSAFTKATAYKMELSMFMILALAAPKGGKKNFRKKVYNMLFVQCKGSLVIFVLSFIKVIVLIIQFNSGRITWLQQGIGQKLITYKQQRKSMKHLTDSPEIHEGRRKSRHFILPQQFNNKT